MTQAGAKRTIRQLREEWGWSQLDLAVRLGASVGAVYKWERGLVVPLPKYRQRLAQLFGVRVEDLALGPVEQGERAKAGEAGSG